MDEFTESRMVSVLLIVLSSLPMRVLQNEKVKTTTTSAVVQHGKPLDVDRYLQKYQWNGSSGQEGFLPILSTMVEYSCRSLIPHKYV